jgi:hypothetical protein
LSIRKKFKKHQVENHHDGGNRIPVQVFFHPNEVRKGDGNIPLSHIGKGYAALTEKQLKTLGFSAFAGLMGRRGKPFMKGGLQN